MDRGGLGKQAGLHNPVLEQVQNYFNYLLSTFNSKSTMTGKICVEK